MREVMGQPVNVWKSMGSWDYVPTFFQNLQKSSLACSECGTLQERYPLWSMVRLSIL